MLPSSKFLLFTVLYCNTIFQGIYVCSTGFVVVREDPPRVVISCPLFSQIRSELAALWHCMLTLSFVILAKQVIALFIFA